MAKLSTQEIIDAIKEMKILEVKELVDAMNCLLYTSPSPRDLAISRMPSSA